MAKILIGNIKGPKGDQGIQGKQGIQGIPGPVGPTGTVDENTPIAFSESLSLSEIESGNSISVLFGKIKKWLSDLNSGAAEKLLGEKLSANRALISDENGNVNASDTVTKTEIERLSGVSSNIQDQLNSLNGNMTLSSGSLTQGTDSWTNSQRTIWQKSGNILHLSGVIKANTNSNSIALGGLPLSGRTISGSAQCIVYCSNNMSGGNQYYVATMSKKNDTELVINLPENVASGDFISFDFEVVLYRLS